VLLQGTGLAKADGSTLKLTNKGKKALKGNLPQIIKDAWGRWQSNKFLDEFSRVDKIKGQKSSRGRTLFAAHTRRPVLYDGLSLCAPGRWLAVKELIRAMNSAGLDFEVVRYAWKLYVGDSQYGHLDEYGDQTMVKTRYVLAFLFEYAAALGIIDVALYPSRRRPFRLPQVGLGHGPYDLPEPLRWAHVYTTQFPGRFCHGNDRWL